MKLTKVKVMSSFPPLQAHKLPKEKLEKRDVINIDIVNDPVANSVSESNNNLCFYLLLPLNQGLQA